MGGRNYTQFGVDIGKSSALLEFVLDFRRGALFETLATERGLGSKIEAKFRILDPLRKNLGRSRQNV